MEKDYGELVCPACRAVCSTDDTTVVQDHFGGMILGFMLRCAYCGKDEFLMMGGNPPLFDLSRSYTFVSSKSA